MVYVCVNVCVCVCVCVCARARGVPFWRAASDWPQTLQVNIVLWSLLLVRHACVCMIVHVSSRRAVSSPIAPFIRRIACVLHVVCFVCVCFVCVFCVL